MESNEVTDLNHKNTMIILRLKNPDGTIAAYCHTGGLY